MADLIRSAGPTFLERNRHWLSWKHIKVLRAIRRCRTAALGGHLDQCTRCGHRALSYNSCRNRHCPKCQTAARDRWIAARRAELLPKPYVHVVFTLPRELAPLALHNQKLVYDLLFRASAQTLLEVADDPRHRGAEIGFFSVLHTWNQKLDLHPHVHCVLPAGGLSPDRTRWIQPRYRFFLPVKVLSRVFRGKFVQALRSAFREDRLRFQGSLAPLAYPKTFAAWLRPLFRKDWVVYCKPPFGGPEHLLQYLGRYTHRVAISNHRLLSFVGGKVTFRWRDSAHHNEQKLLTLSLDEFLRRFLLHLLPKGFVRIRHFGFLASRRRATTLPLCFPSLGSAPAAQPRISAPAPCDLCLCPQCAGPMKVIARFTAAEMQLRSPPVAVAASDHDPQQQLVGCGATLSPAASPRGINLLFSRLSRFDDQPTCLASNDCTLFVLRSTPLCRSCPRFDRSFPPCNPQSGPRPPQPRAAPFQRLYRTRAEHRAQFQFFQKTRVR